MSDDPHTAAVRLLELSGKATATLHAFKLDPKAYDRAYEAAHELKTYAAEHAPAICEALLRMEAALRQIVRWDGFPETGDKWQDGTPVSYGAQYGSNGERDFMRGIAEAALSPRTPQADGFLCTKCKHSFDAVAAGPHTPCPRCGYMAFKVAQADGET